MLNRYAACFLINANIAVRDSLQVNRGMLSGARAGEYDTNRLVSPKAWPAQMDGVAPIGGAADHPTIDLHQGALSSLLRQSAGNRTNGARN